MSIGLAILVVGLLALAVYSKGFRLLLTAIIALVVTTFVIIATNPTSEQFFGFLLICILIFSLSGLRLVIKSPSNMTVAKFIEATKRAQKRHGS